MKNHFSPYILYILLFLQGSVFAQQIKLQVHIKDPAHAKYLKKITYPDMVTDKEHLVSVLDSITGQFERLGFLNARLSKSTEKEGVFHAEFSLGPRIENIRIYLPEGIDPALFRQTAFKVVDNHIDLPFEKLPEFLNSIVKIFESEGDPFVKVRLKNIAIETNRATAQLVIRKERLRKIDEVIVKGYEKFPKGFIRHRLGLKKGRPFNLNKLEEASLQTKGLGFVREIRPPEVLFAPDSTFVYLNLEKRKSNTFDGMIGFGSKTDGTGIRFNGYLDFNLVNIFNKGEEIALNWKNNGNNTQHFNLATHLPYILNSPVSMNLGLNIYRQDTTFNTTTLNIGLQVDIFKNSRVTGIYQSENSTDIRNTSGDRLVTDFKKQKFGLGFTLTKALNDLVFTQHYLFDVQGFYAIRKTDRSESQQIVQLKINYLWPIASRHFAFFQNQSGLLNGDSLYTNELFRLGGVYNIRGFNEESLFASFYSISNLEYRFKATATSYFYALSDYGYLKNEIGKTQTNLFSFGLGYSFHTKAGRIDLIYALGKFQDEPLDFGQSKLHIKIVNTF